MSRRAILMITTLAIVASWLVIAGLLYLSNRH